MYRERLYVMAVPLETVMIVRMSLGVTLMLDTIVGDQILLENDDTLILAIVGRANNWFSFAMECLVSVSLETFRSVGPLVWARY